jgi:hypothetical protein
MMMLVHHGGCDDHHLPLLLLFEASKHRSDTFAGCFGASAPRTGGREVVEVEVITIIMMIMMVPPAG